MFSQPGGLWAFREATVADADMLAEWLRDHVKGFAGKIQLNQTKKMARMFTTYISNRPMFGIATGTPLRFDER